MLFLTLLSLKYLLELNLVDLLFHIFVHFFLIQSFSSQLYQWLVAGFQLCHINFLFGNIFFLFCQFFLLSNISFSLLLYLIGVFVDLQYVFHSLLLLCLHIARHLFDEFLAVLLFNIISSDTAIALLPVILKLLEILKQLIIVLLDVHFTG